MFGTMMRDRLLISSFLVHAAHHHADTEIVSVDISGSTEISTWRQVECNARQMASALGRNKKSAPAAGAVHCAALQMVRLKRWRPRRLTSAPASIDTVAAFRPWRGFRPSVARGRRGHHRDVGRPEGSQFTDQGKQRAMRQRPQPDCASAGRWQRRSLAQAGASTPASRAESAVTRSRPWRPGPPAVARMPARRNGLPHIGNQRPGRPGPTKGGLSWPGSICCLPACWKSSGPCR